MDLLFEDGLELAGEGLLGGLADLFLLGEEFTEDGELRGGGGRWEGGLEGLGKGEGAQLCYHTDRTLRTPYSYFSAVRALYSVTSSLFCTSSNVALTISSFLRAPSRKWKRAS